MIKFFLVSILLLTQTYALDKVKIKATQVDDIINARILIKYNSTLRETAKRIRKKPKYITHVIAKSGNKVLYNFFSNGYLSKNPIFTFKYKNKSYSDVISLNVLDNNGRQYSHNRKIKNYVKTMPQEQKASITNSFVKISSKVWDSTTPEEGIKLLYGLREKIHDNIKIEVKENIVSTMDDGICTFNSSKVHLNLKSDKKLKSMAIFNDSTSKSAIAIFKIPDDAIIDYDFTIVMNTATITVVGEDMNGLLYQTKYKIYVIGSDMNCDGTSNGLGG
jgi:sulfur-oxidizing protein SoxY